jgi:hypothetical protein
MTHDTPDDTMQIDELRRSASVFVDFTRSERPVVDSAARPGLKNSGAVPKRHS